MTLLDLLQMIIGAAIGWASICRLHKLQAGRDRVAVIAAQLAMLGGAAVLALGWWLPGAMRDPATWASVVFSLCVFVTMLVGASRWRDGAPPDVHR